MLLPFLLIQIAPVQGTNLGLPEQGNLVTYIATAISIFLAVIAVVAAAFIVIGGVQYISSRGDEQQAERGKKTVIYAVIGLIVVGLAVIIVNFVTRLWTGAG